MDQELIHWIEDKIVGGVNDDDIILQVAENSDISWQEAELLVQDVLQRRQGRINRRQGPLMLSICLAMVVVGGLAAYALVTRLLATGLAFGAANDNGFSGLLLFADAPYMMLGLAFVLAFTAAGVGGAVKTILGMME